MALNTHIGLYLAAWLELTILVLAAHSDAESGTHETPSSNPCQKLGGTHLELLIAFSLQRNCDPNQWEGCAFCQNMPKEVRQLLLYGKREPLGDCRVRELKDFVKRHRVVQI